MKSSRSICLRNAVFFLLAAGLAACAKPYHLTIKYTTPEDPAILTRNSISLKIIDARETQEIFSKKAGKEFDKWNGGFALVDKDATSGQAVAPTDLNGILKQALEKRLKTMNIDVVDETTEAAPVMEFHLKNFFLDLKDRTWISDFSYEVELSKDGSKTGSEQVRAQAERTKVMGKGGGEKLIGEIFTEGINRLNLKKLFENAGF